MQQVEKAELLSYVANHPDVLPWLAPHLAHVDLSGFMAVPENVMFGDHRGLIIFLYQAKNHTYQLHWLLTEAIRGKTALLMARNAIATMFTNFDCCAITGSTPRDNAPARAMNRALGAVPVGVSTDSQGRACIDYRLERRTWATSLAASSAASAH